MTALSADKPASKSRGFAEFFKELVKPDDRPTKRPLLSLFFASFTTLYVEMVLIRWIGTEVRLFAYFQNLVLIACFLGFGLGCYWAQRRKTTFIGILALFALIALVQFPLTQWKSFLAMNSGLLSLSPDATLWGFVMPLSTFEQIGLSACSVIVTAIFLGLLIAIMVPLGQWVGSYLDMAGNAISAYSVDLAGSVLGIWVSVAMASFWLQPAVWFLVAFGLFLTIRSLSGSQIVIGASIAIASMIFLQMWAIPKMQTLWSPYQKLQVVSLSDSNYLVTVNNTGYMGMASPASESPEEDRVIRETSSYDAPFRFAANRDRVLIVGAGGGNDVDAALRNGAAHIDAVEIDPAIYAIGKDLHPDHPYDSPKVDVIIDDARAFLRRTTERYDVIVFGLLDSHTQFSGYSNMRIDNYVYTEEAFREARKLLKPDGILVLKFEVREPWTWTGQRFFGMFQNIFGRAPVTFHAVPVGNLSAATEFIASDDPALWERAAQTTLAAFLDSHPPQFLTDGSIISPTTDDWPYVYNRDHAIPRTYLTVSLILLAFAVILVRRTFDPRKVSTWHFFLLGMGFLLLETQMVSRLALYFGSTWMVNSIVITTILLMLMAANLFVWRIQPRRLGMYYVLLMLFLLAAYFFPWERLSMSTRMIGLLLAAAYAVPVFFAGVVFTETFRRERSRSLAFGANIVGAVAGGLAQNISFIFGLKVLLLLAAVFYLGAAISGRLRQAHD